MMRDFHEATIVDFQVEDGQVTIKIEDVAVCEGDSERRESGRLVIDGISLFQENDRDVKVPTLKTDDGEILTLIHKEGEVLILLVEWNLWPGPIQATAEYKILGDTVRWLPSSIKQED